MTVFVFIVAAIIDWTVTVILVRASRRFPGIKALRERAILSVVISIALTVYFALVWNSEFGWTLVDRDTGMVFARLAVVIVGLVPAYWLWLYFRGGFAHLDYREGEDDIDRAKRQIKGEK